MHTLKFYLIFFLSLFLESRSYIDYESPYHPVVGTSGMVASQNYLSSKIGVEILNKGGNAVDAAVAVGFSLAATLPRAGNLGGGGFMLVYIKDRDETFAKRGNGWWWGDGWWNGHNETVADRQRKVRKRRKVKHDNG